MPPSKSRQAPPDDSEGSSTRDQKQANSTNSTNGKNRRVANGANAGSSLQNVANTKNNAASNVAVGTGASQDNVTYFNHLAHETKLTHGRWNGPR